MKCRKQLLFLSSQRFFLLAALFHSTMRYPFAWAAGLLLAAACQRHEDPITQQQQAAQTQHEMERAASRLYTPREKATWELVEDIRKLHRTIIIWAGTDSLPSKSIPFDGWAGSKKKGGPLREYPNLAAFKADLQRRTDSLRQTGPLDLSDTLFTASEEAHYREIARDRRKLYYLTGYSL